MTMRRRSSESMKWSWSSLPRSICTQPILPVNRLPRAVYARREHLYSAQTEGEELRAVQRKSLVAVICYVLVILLGLLLPRLAVALYFALAVYLVWPSRHVVARLKSQPSAPAKPPAGA
jgi:hypothetical protein